MIEYVAVSALSALAGAVFGVWICYKRVGAYTYTKADIEGAVDAGYERGYGHGMLTAYAQLDAAYAMLDEMKKRVRSGQGREQ